MLWDSLNADLFNITVADQSHCHLTIDCALAQSRDVKTQLALQRVDDFKARPKPLSREKDLQICRSFNSFPHPGCRVQNYGASIGSKNTLSDTTVLFGYFGTVDSSVPWILRYRGYFGTVDTSVPWILRYRGYFGTVDTSVLWKLRYCGYFGVGTEEYRIWNDMYYGTPAPAKRREMAKRLFYEYVTFRPFASFSTVTTATKRRGRERFACTCSFFFFLYGTHQHTHPLSITPSLSRHAGRYKYIPTSFTNKRVHYQL